MIRMSHRLIARVAERARRKSDAMFCEMRAGSVCSIDFGDCATAPLQSLSSKLVKSRHSLHATNLQCEHGRADAERMRGDVESNDAMIAQLEDQERRLKMQCVCTACTRFFSAPRLTRRGVPACPQTSRPSWHMRRCTLSSTRGSRS